MAALPSWTCQRSDPGPPQYHQPCLQMNRKVAGLLPQSSLGFPQGKGKTGGWCPGYGSGDNSPHVLLPQLDTLSHTFLFTGAHRYMAHTHTVKSTPSGVRKNSVVLGQDTLREEDRQMLAAPRERVWVEGMGLRQCQNNGSKGRATGGEGEGRKA